MIKNQREAIDKFANDTNNYGRVNANNALLHHLQFLASKSSSVDQFAKRKKRFYKKLLEKARVKDVDRNLFNYATQFFAARIVGRIDVTKKGILKNLVKDFLKSVNKELDRKEADAYKKGKDAIDKASKEDGTKLSAPRDTGGEPKVVKKETEKSEKIEPRWKIEFKDIEGIDDATLNAKELFKGMLDGKGILKTGMNETDEQKLQVAAVQQKLGADIDGDYGNNTKAAVEKFQKANKLTQDGKVGRQTITAMFSDTAKGVAKNVPITGKEIDDIMKKTVDNLTKDRKKEYIKVTATDVGREVKLDDKKQRGLEERKRFEDELKNIILEYIRTT